MSQARPYAGEFGTKAEEALSRQRQECRQKIAAYVREIEYWAKLGARATDPAAKIRAVEEVAAIRKLMAPYERSVRTYTDKLAALEQAVKQ